MLYITYLASDGKKRIVTWSIKTALKQPPLPQDKLEDITEIQIDGEELNYIKNNFTGLPLPRNKNIVRYFGSHAKFVVGNL